MARKRYRHGCGGSEAASWRVPIRSLSATSSSIAEYGESTNSNDDHSGIPAAPGAEGNSPDTEASAEGEFPVEVVGDDLGWEAVEPLAFRVGEEPDTGMSASPCTAKTRRASSIPPS